MRACMLTHACLIMSKFNMLPLKFMCIINKFVCLSNILVRSGDVVVYCSSPGVFVLFLQGFCSASTVSLPESLLFVSTLDGNLHAVSKKSGSIKWTLKEGKRRGLELSVTQVFVAFISRHSTLFRLPLQKQSAFVCCHRENNWIPLLFVIHN